MIIFSDDNPLLLQAIIESSRKYLSGIQHINILYHASTDAFKKSYNDLQKLCNNILFHSYQKGTKSNLPQSVEKILSTTDYILFAHDGIIIKEPINLQNCAKALGKTSAYGFYLTLGKNITTHHRLKRPQKLPPFIDLEDGMYAWQFKYGEYNWKKPQTISLALYNTHDIKNDLSNIVYDTPALLEYLWSGISFDMTNIGLTYKHRTSTIP